MAITLQIRMMEIMNSHSSMEKIYTSLKEVTHCSCLTFVIEGEGIEMEQKNKNKTDKAGSKKDKKKGEAEDEGKTPRTTTFAGRNTQAKKEKDDIWRYVTNQDNTHDRRMTNNSICTSKYTMLTFIPKNLFEQFSKMANVYFLFIMVL